MKWIRVKDELPLEKYKFEGVCDEFLVTVELDNPDPNDDREVMLLWFDNTGKEWTYSPAGPLYEEDHDWHVTDWAEKPKPAIWGGEDVTCSDELKSTHTFDPNKKNILRQVWDEVEDTEG